MPTPAPCPGPCNTAWRKAEQGVADTGADHHLAPAWGQPVQCSACTARTRRHLTEIPELLAAVHLEAIHGTRANLTGTIGRASNPSWPGEASRILTDRIVGQMAELAADILTLRGLRPEGTEPDHTGTEGTRINRLTGQLLAHWDWAMQHHPAATESYDRDSANPGSQATSWYRAALRFTRRDTLRVQLTAPCPHCDLRTLAHDDGDTYIECRNPNCGLLLTDSEYLQHTRQLTMGSKESAAA